MTIVKIQEEREQERDKSIGRKEEWKRMSDKEREVEGNQRAKARVITEEEEWGRGWNWLKKKQKNEVNWRRGGKRLAEEEDEAAK